MTREIQKREGGDPKSRIARRGQENDFVRFAEDVLVRLTDGLTPANRRKVPRALWLVTFKRIGAAVFAAAFFVGFVLTGLIIAVAVNLGAPISVPMACSTILFGSYLWASLCTRTRWPTSRFSTPELEEIKAAGALHDESRTTRDDYRKAVVAAVGGQDQARRAFSTPDGDAHRSSSSAA